MKSQDKCLQSEIFYLLASRLPWHFSNVPAATLSVPTDIPVDVLKFAHDRGGSLVLIPPITRKFAIPRQNASRRTV